MLNYYCLNPRIQADISDNIGQLGTLEPWNLAIWINFVNINNDNNNNNNHCLVCKLSAENILVYKRKNTC